MDPIVFFFDIDGTLVDCDGAGMRSLEFAARQLFNGRLSFDGIDAAGRLDPWIFAEAFRRSGFTPDEDQLDELRQTYVEELDDALSHDVMVSRALPGTRPLIERLTRQPGAVVGCLTGNLRAAAEIKLRRSGFDLAHFLLTAYGDEAETRPGLVSLAVQKASDHLGQPLRSDRVVVVGDTPHDVAAAQENGCRSVAVATGRYSERRLTSAGADHVLPDLTDPSVILSMVGDSGA